VELQIAIDRFPTDSETPDTRGNPRGLIARIPPDGASGITPAIDFKAMVFPTKINFDGPPQWGFANTAVGGGGFFAALS
jgi:hypothetical protein